MTITENALKILEKRYFSEGETWESLCTRVSKRIAEGETEHQAEWSEKFKRLLLELDFLPNSPTLRNFGRNKGSGSACFVLPIEDSRKSIFKTLSDAVEIQAYGGGTGFDFSRLRPRGDKISSTEGKSSGPVSFLGIYDYTIGDIIQQGGTRHGANMAILRIDHPDIEEFIGVKLEEGRLRNFNISVGITDQFMQSVRDNADFDLKFSDHIYKTVPARYLWEKMVKGAWQNGEPGIVFLDTINQKNPLHRLGRIEATNPCGEQPLLPYSSCNLGSINLSQVIKGDWLVHSAQVDWAKLESIVTLSVRMLDDVITVNAYPISEIKKMTLKTRQIGLGVMGFADLCIKKHIRYGSDESIDLAQKIMNFIFGKAKQASMDLAAEKGAAPYFDEYQLDPKMRNATLTTIAPTGTLSLIANCSSGCEPHFRFNYTKECLDGEKLKMMPLVVQQWAHKHGGDSLPDFFVDADQVTLKEHINVQAAFQNNGIDAAVSKTINAPNRTTEDEVAESFFMAWEKGCKGITFYRDGSRDVQALYTTRKSSKVGLERGQLIQRPRATTGPNIKMQTACGRLYINPNFDDNDMVEVFMRTEGGGCEANTKAIGVMISYCIRLGIPKEKLLKTLKSIHCPACTKAIALGKNVEVQSCAAAVGRALEYAWGKKDIYCSASKLIDDANDVFSKENGTKFRQDVVHAKCPDCGERLYHADGCRMCPNPECGWSKC